MASDSFSRIVKIKILNSPFDFDEVGQKSALRWVRQGKADLTVDGLLFRDSFTLSVLKHQREDELFDLAVAESCSVRVWKNTHSGPTPMAGGPEYKVKQFVNPPAIPPRETV